jgi:hypothetical protein
MSATIEIMGGLGNQLFQIFTLISYSIKSKKPFYFENKPIFYGQRKKYYWDTILLNELKMFINSPLPDNEQYIYNEPFFHYLPLPFKNLDAVNIKFYGYFQSYKYFEEHKEQILKMINIKESYKQIKAKVSQHLPNTDTEFANIVSLHFRVGDYANLQHAHPLMPIEYYEKALEQLLIDTNGKKNWFILYFCEENDINYVNEKINYLKQNVKFQDFVFSKVPSHLDDWEQMLTMSLCQHHIIANSTFSWWGAYLKERHDGYVYYPSKWFGPALEDKNTKDLYLEGWKKISA